ncbi:MAG: hypothetical protein ACYDCI_05800 [Candidatus Limnocylindrales bacterium]
MAARATMATLITRVRLMIGDPTGASQFFTDDGQIQDALDAHRLDARQGRLIPQPTYAAPGSYAFYFDYYAPVPDWESDWVIQDAVRTVQTPTTSDEITGHWTFATQHIPPLFIIGKAYDRHGAAVDLLETWAASVAQQFDFTTDGQQFARSQKRKGLLALADVYRARAYGYSGLRLVTAEQPW